MVDGATLERLCGRKSTGGSNPPPSANCFRLILLGESFFICNKLFTNLRNAWQQIMMNAGIFSFGEYGSPTCAEAFDVCNLLNWLEATYRGGQTGNASFAGVAHISSSSSPPSNTSFVVIHALSSALPLSLAERM